MNEKKIVVIKLKCGSWSGASKNHQNDLDIDSEVGVPAYVKSLGQKILLPKEWSNKITSVDGLARQFLANNSWPYVEGARVVNELRLPKIFSKLSEFAKQKEGIVEKLIEALPAIKQEMKKFYFKEWERYDWDETKMDNEWKSVASEYLSPEKLRKRCKITYYPEIIEGYKVKEGSEEELLKMAKELEANWNEAKAEAMSVGVSMIQSKISESVTRLCKEIASGKVVKEKTMSAVKHAQEWLQEVVLSVVGEDNDLADISKKLKNEMDKVGKTTHLKADATLSANIKQLGEALAEKIDSIQADVEKGEHKRIIDFS